MATFESESARNIDKFNGENFGLWKFRMEMVLSSMDLWEIVDETESPPPADGDPLVVKEYNRRAKKALTIIGLSLVNSQLAHIKRCKGPAEAWKALCNIHETKSLSNILFVRRKFFTIKMQEGDDLMAHINHVKELADQLMSFEVPVREEDIVMTLLESLPSSFDNLIIALETLRLEDLTMAFVTARMMHEVTKRKEKENHGDDAALFSKQNKGGSSSTRAESRSCFNCGKVGHLARNCSKPKKWERDNANQAKDKENANHVKEEDDYAFATHDGPHVKSLCKWIMDSGATKHMTPHRVAFNTYEVISPRNVHLGDDSVVDAVGVGSIVVDVLVRGQVKKMTIKDVLHVPKLQANLFSVSKFVSSGLKVHFNVDGCTLTAPNGNVLVVAPCEGNLYQVTFTKVHEADAANIAQSSSKVGATELWHRRLGHLNVRSVRFLQSMVSGMTLGKDEASMPFCEGCVQGKQHRAPFPKDGGTRATKPLEIVHSDVCGPMRTTSIGGSRYFVTFIDDFSRRVWLYTLKTKGECLEKFKEFKALAETQSEHKIKAFRSDNGGEFISKAFQRFLKNHGIERQPSTPYTPEQNGVAERANRTIVEMARSMIHAQRLKLSFWAEAVTNAVYIRNRCPTRALVTVTPQEAWSGRKPCISHMRVFGCIAYAKVPDAKRGKLDAKGTKCLFLGYCEGTKAYRLMCVESRKIIRSRDVVFDEDSTSVGHGLEMSPSGSNGTPPLVLVDESFKPTPVSASDDVESKNEDDEGGESSSPTSTQGEGEDEGNSQEPRYPRRERRPLGEWWMNHILPQQEVERANVATLEDPLNLCEAMRSEDASKWEAAMQEEYDSLIANGTWELAVLPTGRKSVGCKWVFRTKKDSSGEVVRHKARLVAKGFSQVAGVDFLETFAPVAKFNTIRCILALGAALDLEIHQMDVKTAFLNGELEEDIYMSQPQGFEEKGSEHLVCKLKKSLYGLKQSPRAWYQCIDSFFTKEGFTRSEADHSLYIKQTGEYLLIVLIYVDDLIILASLGNKLAWLKAKLNEEFEMSDLGELMYCLGVEFVRDRKAHTITMSQSKYIKEVLKRFNMEECKPIGTPLDVNVKLLKLSVEEFEAIEGDMEGVPYKSGVGSLMYAMVATRPDLAFAVSMVSQFMSRAGPAHWSAVKRIMRYLQSTMEYKMCLGGKDFALRGYCDADWAGDANERRSTTGYVFFVGMGAISWNCRRQPTIALSTTEAEYMATSHSTKEAIWLRKLLADVGFVQEGATTIMCDNQGCIALAKNPTHHSRTKHIDVQHHFIREKLDSGEIILKYCPTEDMVADVLTKALAKERHQRLAFEMGLREGNYSQSGSVGD
jgi:transposase InsO family protein